MSGYDRELVEQLIPTLWDRDYAWGMVDERKPDHDMPKLKALKNTANTLWAYLADIRIAWERAPVPVKERRALVLCGGAGLTFQEAGQWLGVSKKVTRDRYEKGIGRLMDFLNGTNTQGDTE